MYSTVGAEASTQWKCCAPTEVHVGSVPGKIASAFISKALAGRARHVFANAQTLEIERASLRNYAAADDGGERGDRLS